MKLLSAEQILSYVNEEEAKHRATLITLKGQGKTYRSRDVTREVAYINAFRDMRDTIMRPQKNAELSEAMARFGNRSRS